MSRIRWILALTLVFATCAVVHAATFRLDNEDMSYDSRKPGFVVDVNGNIHTVNRGYWDGGPAGWSVNEHLLYHLVESATGDELIDDTWLTVGDEQARVQLIWLPDGKLGVLYHESGDEVFVAVLDPSLHAQDGTDANATATTPVPDAGNTGNGTMSAVQTGAAVTQTEDWTVEYDGSEWTVTGSVSGELASTLNDVDGDYNPGSNGEATPVAFTLTNGGTGFASGDKFTFSTTASPILVEPATPISGSGGGYSHAARAALTADDRLFVVWRTGGYEVNDTELNSRVITPGGSMESIEQIDDFGSAERFSDYGQNYVEVISNGIGHHVLFSNYDQETYSDYATILRYMVIDPLSKSEVVAYTPVRFNVYAGDSYGARRPVFRTLPNGNAFVAFQDYIEADSYSQLFTMIFDPLAAGGNGDPLVEEVSASANPANTGDGIMSMVQVSLSAPAGTVAWTVTCTDDSVAGSEVWSVEDGTKTTYRDATTGVPYTTETGAILFEITDIGTDFAVGDEFTFTTVNDAVVQEPTNINSSRNFHHPEAYVDPNGAGIYLAFAEGNNAAATYDEIYFAVLGYDGEVLEGPVQVSDSNGGDDGIDWTFEPAIGLAGGKVALAWVQFFQSDDVDSQVLALENNPADVPTITSVDPASGEEGVETEIVITGTKFATGVKVFVGDTELTTVTRDSATQITATVPGTLAADTYDVKAENPDTLFAVAADAFEVTASSTDDDADDDTDDDSGDDDTGDDDSGDDDAGDDDASGGGDDDDDDGGCCGC